MNSTIGHYKEDLFKFKIPQAKMLYMIYYLSKTNDINFSQKSKLKELVIKDDKHLIKIFNTFEKSLDIHKFISEIMTAFFEDKQAESKTIDVKSLQIITNKEQIKKQQERLKEAQQQNAVAELTSPTGNDLLDKKKKRMKKQTMPAEEIKIDECDVGMSPKIVVNKAIKNDKKKTFLEHAVGHINNNVK